MSQATTPTDDRHELTEKWRTFFERYYHGENSAVVELAKGFPRHQKSIRVEYEDLLRFNLHLADDLLDNPRTILEYASKGLTEVAIPFDVDGDLVDAHVRVGGLEEAAVYDVGDIYDQDVGRYIGIKGQVAKVSQPKQRVTEGAYNCLRCGCVNRTPDGAEPHECEHCERQGPFDLIPDQSKTITQQWIRLQRPPEKTAGVDATMDIRLVGRDLVDQTVSPGDRIVVNTILEQREDVDEDDRTVEFEFVGKGLSIDLQETTFEDIDYMGSIDEIREIAKEEPFDQLVESIAPSIRGYKREKLAIALQLFGGTQKETSSGETIRGDSHIAFIGDPGTGKTAMLQFADSVAPRSVYTGGHDTTGAGLTAAAVQDDFGDGGWTIKGGALVQADGGLCCIDELDDMDEEELGALNEALESQEVHVSKAGERATLPARTTVLTTANPAYGRFDDYEPVAQQIDIPAPLFSRFDLIFTFTDRPDEQRDRKILSDMTQTARAAQQRASGTEVTAEDPSEPAIEPELIRKYVAYARQEITPVMTPEAGEAITQSMTDLRQAADQDTGDDENAPIPVTMRKQEAFVRLSEASARARLSNEVEKEDVDRARTLIMKCMEDVGIDPDTGQYDADVVETGRSRSQQRAMKQLYALIENIQDEHEHGAPIDELEEIVDYSRGKLDHRIGNLKDKGEIYNPQPGYVRTT